MTEPSIFPRSTRRPCTPRTNSGRSRPAAGSRPRSRGFGLGLLGARGRAWRSPWLLPLLGGAAALRLLLCLVRTPDPAEALSYSSLLFDRTGKLAGASIAPDGQWRFPPGGAPSARFAAALVRSEDRRFYLHSGVDPASLLAALWEDLKAGSIERGGSTITMQAARAMRGYQGRTIGEKLLESLLALRLEASFTKEQVIAFYAARAPFGGNVVGLEAASWRWFDRPPDRLSWAETATLAALPNSPALVHPGRNREALRARRDGILRSLAAAGNIDAEELALALAEPLPDEPRGIPQEAPHLLERAKRETGSWRVESSIDPEVQGAATRAVNLYSRRYAEGGVLNAACVVVDVPTGEVLAYVGNSDLSARSGAALGPTPAAAAAGNSAYVDIASAPRSSGSILKPFLYAALLEAGELLPASLVLDIPLRIGSFSPENNTLGYVGATQADKALARSLNIPAVRELRQYGVDRFRSLLEGMGMTTLSRKADDYGLTLILGGAEARLDELAGMYASLARTAAAASDEEAAAAWRDPAYVRGAKGELRRNPLSRGSAWLTLQALVQGNRPGDEAAWQDYASSRMIAWKTGTSFGWRDAWSVGVTGRYAVAVWVGNATGEARPSIKGAEMAAPLLFNVFSSLPTSPWIEPPSGSLVHATVCARSGWIAGPDCAETRDELVPRAGLQAERCPYCAVIHLDRTGKWRVTSECEAVAEMQTRRTFVLPPAVEHWYLMSHVDYSPPPPWKPGCAPDGELPSMGLVFPESGTAVYIPVEIDGKPGKVSMQAVHRMRGAKIYWDLDGEYLGATEGNHQMECRPAYGKHRLTLSDAYGERIERVFYVLSD